ncbi:beta-phosphoglucomutase [Blautia schinkii]|nr:beta-phosphoglucomutase [Blautia schinkii]
MKAVIFDLDGVLVHTDKYHYLAWKMLADRLGIYFDEKINDRLRGVSRMESLEIILEKYRGKPLSEAQKTELADEKNKVYRALLKGMTPADVSEEVRRTLEVLKYRGYQMAIGSSSKNARYIVEQTGLDKEFDAVADGTNISRSKPDPEVFLKAAEFISQVPEECLVVEDAKAGILAAKKGGFKSAGLGEAKNYELTDYPLESIGDLLKLLV